MHARAKLPPLPSWLRGRRPHLETSPQSARCNSLALDDTSLWKQKGASSPICTHLARRANGNSAVAISSRCRRGRESLGKMRLARSFDKLRKHPIRHKTPYLQPKHCSSDGRGRNGLTQDDFVSQRRSYSADGGGIVRICGYKNDSNVTFF